MEDWQFLKEYTPILIGVLSGLLACIAYDMIKAVRHKTPEEQVRAITMTKHRRALWVKRYMQYLLSEVVEEGYLTEKITMEERDFWLQRMGSRLDLIDLLPRKHVIKPPEPEDLKAQIRARNPGIDDKLNKIKNNGFKGTLVLRKQPA